MNQSTIEKSLATEPSIRTRRMFIMKVVSSVVYAETSSKMKILGAKHWGIKNLSVDRQDTEFDSTLRVFKGWWHGRFFAQF